MPASLENLSGLIRVGRDHHVYGDPWEFICGYSSVDGKTAVLKGLRTFAPGFGKEHADAINDALHAAGFQFASWDRHKNGRVRPVIVRVGRRGALTRRNAGA